MKWLELLLCSGCGDKEQEPNWLAFRIHLHYFRHYSTCEPYCDAVSPGMPGCVRADQYCLMRLKGISTMAWVELCIGDASITGDRTWEWRLKLPWRTWYNHRGINWIIESLLQCGWKHAPPKMKGPAECDNKNTVSLQSPSFLIFTFTLFQDYPLYHHAQGELNNLWVSW